MKIPSLFKISLFFLILIFAGCTHNGGPSGPLYGRWHLERIEGENMAEPAQSGEIFWAFQSGMIQIQRDNGNHSVSTIYGSYRLVDDTMFIDFPEEKFVPFTEVGLGRENILQVLKLTRSEFILLYNPDPSDPSVSLTYYLKKW